MRLRETSDYLYTHSVSSAIWATVMARHLGMPKETIELVGLGAILLDIGKTRLPMQILTKPGPLTEAELVIVRSHVEHGIEILKETDGVDEQVLAMVRTHHERHDGSGYPLGLSGPQIPVLGRIDDFGTGNSSLCYFRDIPADEVKIDRSFVLAMTDERNHRLVKSIVDLAHGFELDVVAEGVETAEVAEALRQLGCDALQGHHFSQPVPQPRLLEYLAQYSPVRHAGLRA